MLQFRRRFYGLSLCYLLAKDSRCIVIIRVTQVQTKIINSRLSPSLMRLSANSIDQSCVICQKRKSYITFSIRRFASFFHRQCWVCLWYLLLAHCRNTPCTKSHHSSFSTNDLYELKTSTNIWSMNALRKSKSAEQSISDAALTLHPLRFRKEVVYFCSQNERQKMSHKSIVGMKDKRFRNPLKDPTTLGTFRALFVNFRRKGNLQQA